MATFKRVLDSGLLFGFILVEKEEEVGREWGMRVDLFAKGTMKGFSECAAFIFVMRVS